MKRSTTIVAVGVFVLIIVVLNVDFINGYMYLINDEKVMNTLSEEKYLEEYPYIKLHKITVIKSIYYSEHSDFYRNTRLNFTFFIRPFNAWKYPRDEVPLEDNWKLHGYVTMDGQVFYVYISPGGQLLE